MEDDARFGIGIKATNSSSPHIIIEHLLNGVRFLSSQKMMQDLEMDPMQITHPHHIYS